MDSLFAASHMTHESGGNVWRLASSYSDNKPKLLTRAGKVGAHLGRKGSRVAPTPVVVELLWCVACTRHDTEMSIG